MNRSCLLALRSAELSQLRNHDLSSNKKAITIDSVIEYKLLYSSSIIWKRSASGLKESLEIVKHRCLANISGQWTLLI